MEEDDLKEFEGLRDYALALKDKLGLPSIDTAILIMIYSKLDIISGDIDTIRFHNSD